ncbi:MAG: hypothetical protein JWQ49_2247 [Edaphobacter sp.]|nr:hypothetical protein [Edaphobacter sp.]
MLRLAPIRLAAAAGLAFCASLPAQSPRPPQAMPPSSTPNSSTLPATTTPEPPPVPLTPSQRPPQRAQVTYAEGALSVAADNASLNQILRQIASDTGIKITGGVTDERVFGQYGPADPAQVLAMLLDGTGSNMILVNHDGDTPSELILTPRQGAPTPPNPTATAFNDRSEPYQAPLQSVQPAPYAQPQGNPVIPPANTGPPGAAPTNSSQPDNPNGVKTPQQIYEQLQRMRQQQQQPNPPQ